RSHARDSPVSTILSLSLDPAPAELYTLSLHDALPIWTRLRARQPGSGAALGPARGGSGTQEPDAAAPQALGDPRRAGFARRRTRSEEHTSELQSRENLVCRLLLEKKKDKQSETPAANT